MAATSGERMAMMGVLFYRRFFLAAVGFVAVAVVAPLAVDIQWYLLGGMWWLAIFVPGLSLHRERVRRSADQTVVV